MRRHAQTRVAKMAKWSRLDPVSGCVLWAGAIDSDGYGRVRFRDKTPPAHRAAYELAHGPIPDGLQIDHLCRVRSCVNPEHLEAVTTQTNTLRGEGISAQHARKTTCPLGHPFDMTWKSTPSRRRCRACRNTQRRMRYATLKVTAAARASEMEPRT